MTEFYDHRNVEPRRRRCHALISVGGNLPGPDGRTPAETCRAAVSQMDLLPYARVCGVSRWFQTAPIPVSDQPAYVNAVAALRLEAGYAEDPALLLRHLMDIETECGRRRGVANAARTLDLDIIAIGGMVRRSPDPVLPHPRAHERAFVLLPLLDVAPGWVHPVLQRSARELLADLPPQPIRPLPD